MEESPFAGSGLRRILLPNALEFIAVSAFVETQVYYVAIERGDAVSGPFLHHKKR
jgi:hypothetical protein